MPVTLEDVRRLYPRIIQPPHGYYDVANEKGTSPFKAGLPSAEYQPFIDHFTERIVTATAQARLDRRKGRIVRADEYQRHARKWAAALRMALARQQRSALAELVDSQARELDLCDK